MACNTCVVALSCQCGNHLLVLGSMAQCGDRYKPCVLACRWDHALCVAEIACATGKVHGVKVQIRLTKKQLTTLLEQFC